MAVWWISCWTCDGSIHRQRQPSMGPKRTFSCSATPWGDGRSQLPPRSGRSKEHLASWRPDLSRHPSESPHSLHLSAPPWLPAPSWMPIGLVQPWGHSGEALGRRVGCARERVERREHGHRVSFVASMAYCARCACFTQRRVCCRFKGDAKYHWVERRPRSAIVSIGFVADPTR